MNDSKKLLKAMLGDQGYETLEKAIYKQRTQAVIDPLEYYLPLIVVPRTIISWLVQTIRPMKTGEIKDCKFPGRDDISIHFEKQDIDQYRAEFVSAGRIIHTFEKQSLPAASAHLMTVGELYDDFADKGKSSDEIVAEEAKAKPELEESKKEGPRADIGAIQQMIALANVAPAQDPESIKWEMSHANVRELTSVIGKLVDSLTAKQMSRNRLEDELDKVSEKEVKDQQGKIEASQTPEEKAKADAAAQKANPAIEEPGMGDIAFQKLQAKPSAEQKGPECKVVEAGDEAAEGKISKESLHEASMQASRNISSPRMAGAHQDQDKQHNIDQRISSMNTTKGYFRKKHEILMKPDSVKKEEKGSTPKFDIERHRSRLDSMTYHAHKAAGATHEQAFAAVNAKRQKMGFPPRKDPMSKEEMGKAEMPKGAGQPQQPAKPKEPKAPVPPGNAPAASAAKQAQSAGKGGYKPPQTPGAQAPHNAVAAQQKMAPKAPVNKKEYFQQKLGKAPMTKSEKIHLATEDQLYKSKCEDCGTAEFVKGEDGNPKFNPCACFRVLKNDEEGRPYRFVQPIKKSDGTFGLQFAKNADPEQVKLFLLTLKARLLIKKKTGI